jgi:hypothetical protein
MNTPLRDLMSAHQACLDLDSVALIAEPDTASGDAIESPLESGNRPGLFSEMRTP